MKRACLTVAGLLLAGCFPGTVRPSKALMRWYWANAHNPTCDGLRSPPSVTVTHGYRVNCGLVTVEMNSTPYVEGFVASVCKGVSDESCERAYQQTFVARLIERYGFANADRVSLTCQAHPQQCMTMKGLEHEMMRSHNAELLARFDAAMEERRAAAAREAEEDRAAWGRALGQLADDLRPPPAVNCHSYTVGDSTNTTCRQTP